MPGVAFSIDPDTGKPYSVLNYHNWIWEDLVSWNISWKTVKISDSANLDYISSDLHIKIKKALDYLTQQLWEKYIDIEFAYDSLNLYLLQVRPITKLPSSFYSISDVTQRYINYISSIITKKDKVFWNMIDINPEELIWKESILIQTFFSSIFPESSLWEFRSNVWYKTTDNFLKFVWNKPYIDLKENLKSFLPNTLNERETKIFEDYYINLIKNKPSLQNQLDSVLYPNSIEIVNDILIASKVDLETQKTIINKFEIFFSNLTLKFEELTNSYSEIEKELLNDLWAQNFLDLLMIDNFNWSIEELLELIKKSTYYFTAFARIFFFSSNNSNEENHKYFRNNIYQSLIINEMEKQSIDSVSYQISKWFNFLDFLDQTIYLKDKKESSIDQKEAKMIDISKVWRENIKFLFMNLFRLLWNKIVIEIEKNWLKKDDIKFIPFDKLLEFLRFEFWKNKLDYYIKKWKLRENILNSLELSWVLFNTNTLIECEKISDKGFFIWNWELEWELYYVNSLDDFLHDDYIWKIIVIENATPEIDLYLPMISWVITKNWWPLAHIAIRARELGIPAIVWSSYYEQIFLEKVKKVSIDFKNEKIDFLN